MVELIVDHTMDRSDSHRPRERIRGSWYRLMRTQGPVRLRDCCSVCMSFHKGEFCPALFDSTLIRRQIVQREYERAAMPPYVYHISSTPYPDVRAMDESEYNEDEEPFPPCEVEHHVPDWPLLRQNQRSPSPTVSDVSLDSRDGDPRDSDDEGAHVGSVSGIGTAPRATSIAGSLEETIYTGARYAGTPSADDVQSVSSVDLSLLNPEQVGLEEVRQMICRLQERQRQLADAESAAADADSGIGSAESAVVAPVSAVEPASGSAAAMDVDEGGAPAPSGLPPNDDQ